MPPPWAKRRECVPPLNVGERLRRRATRGSPPGANDGEPRRHGGVAAQPREEFLLALRVGVARRGSWVGAVGEAAARQRVRQKLLPKECQ